MEENFDRYGDRYGENAEYDPEVMEQIRLAKLRRERADRLAKDRLHAQMVLAGGAVLIIIVVALLIVKASGAKEPEGTYAGEQADTVSQAQAQVQTQSQAQAEDSVAEAQSQTADDTAQQTGDYAGQAAGHTLVTQNGITYVDGIMIVNKTFSLPSDYAPGLDAEASAAFDSMAAQAWGEGISLWICSGYRSYEEQVTLFEGYAAERGLNEADDVSARPGHSEHQSGLCMDVNTTEFSFAGTPEAIWLEEHCAEYGFIIRFPEGKESITGYDYEPWHIRYVGVEAAQAITAQGLCLEEYLNVTSDYADSPDNEAFIERYSQYDYSADTTSSVSGYYEYEDYGNMY